MNNVSVKKGVIKIETKTTGIYEIKNIINNKTYIGSSTNIEQRWRKHISELNNNIHSNKHLQSSWNKYGKENFKFNIIEITTKNKNEIILREQFWMDRTQCYNKEYGYNKRKEAQTNLGIVISTEGRKNISNGHKGNKNYFYGKQRSQEVKEKISKAKLGSYQSEGTKLKRSVSQSGEKGNKSKLTENQVIEIRKLYKQNIGVVEIAKIFNVSPTTISRIGLRKTWKYTNLEEIMYKILEIFNQLNKESSRNGKELILKNNIANQLFKDILKFVYDPYIITGIADKKLNKFLLKEFLYNNRIKNIYELITYLKTNNTGSDENIKDVVSFIKSQDNCLQELYIKIITKNLKVGIDLTTINKIFGDNFINQFSVMLAKKYDDYKEKVKGNFVLTKKLDGNRIIVIKDNSIVKSFTRQGNQYEGLEEIESDIKNLPYDNIIFDGELIADTDGSTHEIYTETTSKARSKGSNKTGLLFHIFDTLPLNEFQKGASKDKCIERKNRLTSIFNNCNLLHCKEVEPLYIGNDLTQIEVWKKYAQEQSWEGLMLNLDSPYVCKRTDTILKVKVMQTADLKIIGFEEGTGKNVGKLGALIVNYKGYKVGVGSGFSDYDRDYIWNHKEEYINKITEIQYFEESKNQDGGISLRFPVYKKVRTDKTEESYN
jgi:DNA ligase-1